MSRRRRHRRRRMFVSSRSRSRSRGGVRWIEPGRRRRGRGRGRALLLVGVLVLAALAAGAAIVVVGRERDSDRMRTAAADFAAAWAKRDARAMWAQLTPRARATYPLRRFAAGYRSAERAATVVAVRAGAVRGPREGRVAVPVALRTRRFGTLRGTIALPVKEDGVVWAPHLRLPGLRAGERVRRSVRRRPRRASVLGADGRRLARDPGGAGIAGTPPSEGEPGSGLEQLYDARLAGRPASELRFGERVIARAPGRRARSVHATIRPGLQRAALAALGDRLGGVAVLRPRSGDVLALAGPAVSAPQPPGSTFKIVTLAGALDAGITKPSSVYPVRTSATLSGVRVRNASDESCGGTLVASFAHSCNSVFAPLGARLGARRLVRTAEAFGFNERPRVPAAKPSTISRELKDSLAVGAAAIGQDRDLATPLQMASVGATIAAGGMRARPRIVREEPVVRRRAARARTARQVRSMMLAVVRGGTGTAAAIPGVEVAGKTGTAELRPTAGGPADPKNTDAWFVAFAPARSPRVAVAVMLIGAGAGGQAAAPIARRVLQAAL